MLVKDVKRGLTAVNGELTGEVLATYRGSYHGIKRVVTVNGKWPCLELDDHTVQAVRELVHALDLFNPARELRVKKGDDLFSISAVVMDAAGRLVVVSNDTRPGFPRTRGGE